MQNGGKEAISILINKNLFFDLKEAYEGSNAPSFSQFLQKLIHIGLTELKGGKI